MSTFRPVIGLEIHVELKTKTGMFCQCRVNQFDAKPNTNVCPVCLGLPGALPVPNMQAIEWTIKIGQALNCTINRHTKFDRKHYNYPDLPKGYQISQYDEPIAVEGRMDFEANYGTYKNEKRSFRIHRVHLEEDTGKLTHKDGDTLVDFNRSGTPLVEIVTEPDFTSSDDVKMFLEELHTIIRYLEVSDADMEKGTMRMEPNISVRLPGQTELPSYKVEIKNINSFNFVKRAIDFEIKRHTELLKKNKTPAQETRGFDSDKGVTYSQRSKEEAHDYRYFPEPDIPPFEFTAQFIQEIKKTAVELPADKALRFTRIYGIKPLDAYTLTREKELSEYFENILKKIPSEKAQSIANLIINKKLPVTLSVEEFAEKAAHLFKPKETDTVLLDEIISRLISSNPKVVKDYKSGKDAAIKFFIGQVMREMKGKADATLVFTRLKEALK